MLYSCAHYGNCGRQRVNTVFFDELSRLERYVPQRVLSTLELTSDDGVTYDCS